MIIKITIEERYDINDDKDTKLNPKEHVTLRSIEPMNKLRKRYGFRIVDPKLPGDKVFSHDAGAKPWNLLANLGKYLSTNIWGRGL